FTVRLPYARHGPGPGPGDPVRASGRRLKWVKVLVVDDEPDAQEFIKKLLEESEAEVRTAGSAAEAIEVLKEELPHVLVSDIGMPREDGYVLLGRVQALAPGLPA